MPAEQTPPPPKEPARTHLRRPAAAVAAALLVIAAAVLITVDRPPTAITPLEASRGDRLRSAPAPPAELESGYTWDQGRGTPPNPPTSTLDRQPARRVERIPMPRASVPSSGFQAVAPARASAPAAAEAEVVTPRQSSSRSRSAGASSPALPADSPALALPGLQSPSTEQAAASPSAPPASSDAPPAAPSDAPGARSAPTVISPPVPLALDPPPHPGVWHVVVETPGLVAEAQPAQASARVRLRLLVREDGSVGRVDVAVSSGRLELDAAAAAAARYWRFLPARRDGSAIASTVLIWVSFVVGP